MTWKQHFEVDPVMFSSHHSDYKSSQNQLQVHWSWLS